jgi:transaldolase
MSLKSLIATGTKLWLDGVEPELILKSRDLGVTGATSNPIIISKIIQSGSRNQKIAELLERGLDDDVIAWELTDGLVREAQEVFAPVWDQTNGNDGYVSFELDPLLEDVENPVPLDEKTRRYVELGKKWSAGHTNRMIKVPATEGGLAALEELAAAGVTINVTIIFTERQYRIARDNIWRGAQRRKDGLSRFKSVYSIFISRVDVYTDEHVPELSPAAQGQVGIANAKELWRDNQKFWADKNLPRQQEIVFASTGTKNPADPPDKYVQALAGSDIQTNPPKTNDAVEKLNKTYTRQVDKLPPQDVLDEIEKKVDMGKLETTLMEEGTKKFADPFKLLIKQIADKRKELAPAK